MSKYYYSAEEVKAMVNQEAIASMMCPRFAHDGDDYNTVIRYNAGVACYNEGIGQLAVAIGQAMDAAANEGATDGTGT